MISSRLGYWILYSFKLILEDSYKNHRLLYRMWDLFKMYLLVYFSFHCSFNCIFFLGVGSILI
jgi:hypothetical protein